MELLLSLLLLLLVWITWRYLALRRAVESYARAVRRAADENQPPSGLASVSSELEPLSGAFSALREAHLARLAESQASRARLAAVLEQMTDGVLIADAEGRVRFANPAAEKIFNNGRPLAGYTVTESIRHHQLVSAWKRCRETGEIQSESAEIPARRQFIQLVVIPDQNEPGSILVAQDLTRIRRLETVRRDFISNISHELRTPLASLKALAETLREGALDDRPAAMRFLARMETEVDALTQMAGELLDLSRIESGQVTLEKNPIAPCKLLASAADRMKAQAERAHLTLTLDCPPDLPAPPADFARLEQVLVNLIHNAVKFTPPGGEISLRARGQDGLVEFSVRDTGPGIPPDDLPRIFERFYKADRARTKSGGTGLGLSIARHIVEAHGGKIWAESQTSQGSTFYFTLPL